MVSLELARRSIYIFRFLMDFSWGFLFPFSNVIVEIPSRVTWILIRLLIAFRVWRPGVDAEVAVGEVLSVDVRHFRCVFI